MQIQIPFAGFYYSVHDDECNREIEYMFDYFASETGRDIPQSLADKLWDSVDWHGLRQKYAREYVESFLVEYDIEGKAHKHVLVSPREYNFQTDRVFADISLKAVAKLWRETDKSTLDDVCKERHTSRDGFISHYSNDWRDWGRLSNWDYNQLYTLLGAWLASTQCDGFDQYAELDLMESWCGNGGLSDATDDSAEFQKTARIYDYLIERARRPVKTMAQWRIAFAKPWDSTPLGAL